MDNVGNALAVSGSDLYAGGGFTTAGGSAANYIAKWDGSSWSALGSGMNGAVSCAGGVGQRPVCGGRFHDGGREGITLHGQGSPRCAGNGPARQWRGNRRRRQHADLANYTDFGSAGAGSGTVVRTFTIQNTGGAALNLSARQGRGERHARSGFHGDTPTRLARLQQRRHDDVPSDIRSQRNRPRARPC